MLNVVKVTRQTKVKDCTRNTSARLISLVLVDSENVIYVFRYKAYVRVKNMFYQKYVLSK